MSDIRKYINLVESAEFKPEGEEQDALQHLRNEPDPSPDPEEEAANKQLVQKMSSALGTLPPNLERILRMRYGINTPEASIYDIGTELGIKPNVVLGLERKALKMLQHPSRSRAIRGFMNN